MGDNDNLPGFGFFQSFGFSQCATSLANKVYVVQENEISVYSRPNKYLNQSLKSTEFFHVSFLIILMSIIIIRKR